MEEKFQWKKIPQNDPKHLVKMSSFDDFAVFLGILRTNS